MTSFFPQNYILPECKSEWNREAITVFSRLPSLRRLQATPLLQPYLGPPVSIFAPSNHNSCPVTVLVMSTVFLESHLLFTSCMLL